MKIIWCVALGGAAGSVFRYLVASAVQGRAGLDFPAGTLLVNLSGCLLLGFLIHYTLATPAITPEVRALLTTGLCGGYTTFSTFSYETVALIQDGDWRRAVLYVGLSVLGSIVGVILGIAGARQLLAWRGVW
ncbi:MAG TPA: fluoride efflux transporter CrcB [Gemmatimonadales bacterium]|jgi:CrcB protein